VSIAPIRECIPPRSGEPLTLSREDSPSTVLPPHSPNDPYMSGWVRTSPIPPSRDVFFPSRPYKLQDLLTRGVRWTRGSSASEPPSFYLALSKGVVLPSWASAAWEGIVVRGPGNERGGTKARGRIRKRNTRASVVGGLGCPERSSRKRGMPSCERIRPRQRRPYTQ